MGLIDSPLGSPTLSGLPVFIGKLPAGPFSILFCAVAIARVKTIKPFAGSCAFTVNYAGRVTLRGADQFFGSTDSCATKTADQLHLPTTSSPSRPLRHGFSSC